MAGGTMIVIPPNAHSRLPAPVVAKSHFRNDALPGIARTGRCSTISEMTFSNPFNP